VTCFCDSQLVIKHLSKEYRLKDDELRKLYHQVRTNCEVFEDVRFQHMSETQQRIQRADMLVKEAHQGRCIDRCHVEP